MKGGIVLLTEGRPWKCILRFALPLFLGSLLQQMYYTVDAMMVGRLAGEQALSRVGIWYRRLKHRTWEADAPFVYMYRRYEVLRFLGRKIRISLSDVMLIIKICTCRRRLYIRQSLLIRHRISGRENGTVSVPG